MKSEIQKKWRQVKPVRLQKPAVPLLLKPVALPLEVVRRLQQARRDALDRAALEHIYERIPAMRAVIEAHPPPHFVHCDVFTVLVQAIVWQQLSARAAAKLWPRLVQTLEQHTPGAIHRAAPYLYVNPQPLANITDPTLLRAAGLPQSRCIALVEAARAFHSTPELYANWDDALDDEEVIRRLTRLRGIGEWTAQMVLMFAMRRMDVLPTGDLGVRRGFSVVFDLKPDSKGKQTARGRDRVVLPSPAAVEAFARSDACGGGRFLTVISYYMWRAAGADVLVPDGTLPRDSPNAAQVMTQE
jgi:DNA-3-methyladenine glycosylase II